MTKRGKQDSQSGGAWESVLHREYREDLRYWVKTDRKIALRALDLMEAIVRNPLEGIGKPEALRYLGPGVWSRRLTQEHRLVYRVGKWRVEFIQARYHY